MNDRRKDHHTRDRIDKIQSTVEDQVKELEEGRKRNANAIAHAQQLIERWIVRFGIAIALIGFVCIVSLALFGCQQRSLNDRSKENRALTLRMSQLTKDLAYTQTQQQRQRRASALTSCENREDLKADLRRVLRKFNVDVTTLPIGSDGRISLAPLPGGDRACELYAAKVAP